MNEAQKTAVINVNEIRYKHALSLGMSGWNMPLVKPGFKRLLDDSTKPYSNAIPVMLMRDGGVGGRGMLLECQARNLKAINVLLPSPSHALLATFAVKWLPRDDSRR